MKKLYDTLCTSCEKKGQGWFLSLDERGECSSCHSEVIPQFPMPSFKIGVDLPSHGKAGEKVEWGTAGKFNPRTRKVESI